MKDGAKIFGISFLIIVVAAFFTWLVGWVILPMRITSVNNVEKQWRFAYEYLESLQAAAQQVCTAEKAMNNATTENERIQRQTQVIALENNYARIAADYDARLRNAFEAGLVAPPDVPRQAPNLSSMKSQVCSQ